MAVQRLLVERVDLRRFGAAAVRNDVRGDSLDRCPLRPVRKASPPRARRRVRQRRRLTAAP